MNKDYAPVILFTYNRPDHTKQVLDALAKNKLAIESDLYIFVDGPKGGIANKNNELTKEVVLGEQGKGRFKSVNVTVSPVNKGLAKSIISGVTEVIEKYGRCIVLEDDHITSVDFLRYMNDCLKFYEHDEKIWSISGFTYSLRSLEKYDKQVYLSYRACSHGWATWIDRWQSVDWQVSDFANLKKSLSARRKFNRGGNDLYRMLNHQMNGERDSWAIRFCYSQSKQDKLTVYPRVSLIKNIGFDGSGTHCGVATDTKAIQFAENSDIYPEEVVINKKITRDFKNQYRVTIKEAFHWLLRKLGWAKKV